LNPVTREYVESIAIGLLLKIFFIAYLEIIFSIQHIPTDWSKAAERGGSHEVV
jgi:hypothetical protein